MAHSVQGPGEAARVDDIPADATVVVGTIAEERVSVASQWQLMWWRFRKHRLAMIAAVIVALFYAQVLAADFLAYADPEASDANRGLIAPQPIHWLDEGRFAPYVNPLVGKRDPATLKRVYVIDEEQKIPITFFAQGAPYQLGPIGGDRHLFGVATGDAEK